MKKLVIIGAGDVGKYIAYHFSSMSDYEIIGFLDDDNSKWGDIYAGLPVLGGLSYINGVDECAVVIGIADPRIKMKIYYKLKNISNLEFPNLIHPKSWVGANVSLGKGNIIYPGVMINYETKISSFIIINMNCAIGHNCVIADYTTLSPGVNLGGFTQIGEASFIGIGANTIQSIFIGCQSTIGGGSMIIRDVPDGCTAVGNPGRIVKSSKQ